MGEHVCFPSRQDFGNCRVRQITALSPGCLFNPPLWRVVTRAFGLGLCGDSHRSDLVAELSNLSASGRSVVEPSDVRHETVYCHEKIYPHILSVAVTFPPLMCSSDVFF
jgi:hypothetical protein